MDLPLVMDLEQRGLILRLHPGSTRPSAQPNTTLVQPLYKSDPAYGPHMLISVTVNRHLLPAFGTHPDNEDILLIGDAASYRLLYLVLALCKRQELERKIKQRSLSQQNFVAMEASFNNPQVSYFVMLKDTPTANTPPLATALPHLST